MLACYLELVGVAPECDHLCTAPHKLRVLDGVSAKSTDAKDAEYPVRAERTGIAEFFDAAIRCESCVGKRCQFFKLQPTVNFDQIARWDGDELCKASHRSESRPTHVRANVSIANLAMATRAVAPARCDDHMSTLLKPRRFGNDGADLAHHASNL